MVGISAVVITKNEANNIGACLDSLCEVADEIIVCDSFSTDNTAEICKKYEKVHFLQHKFDNYSAQKNRANDLAIYDYILSLDADECLSEVLIKKILKIKKKPKYSAYRFPRLNHIGEKPLKHGLWFPDRKIRLFKKDTAKWQGTGVHEVLEVNKGQHVKSFSLPILHFPYDNAMQFREKSESYSSLWAEDMFRKNKRVFFVSPYFHAAWTAFRGFILKLAFLDGKEGMKLLNGCIRDSYLKYKKLYRLSKNGRLQ